MREKLQVNQLPCCSDHLSRTSDKRQVCSQESKTHKCLELETQSVQLCGLDVQSKNDSKDCRICRDRHVLGLYLNHGLVFLKNVNGLFA